MSRPSRLVLSGFRVRPLSLAYFAGIAASLAVMVGLAAADLGAWSPTRDWSRGHSERYAVHLLLLKGDGNPHHSRVLWFHKQLLGPDVMLGGQWGWTPGNDGCSDFPDANFAQLDAPTASMDLFCSGHAAIGDNGAVLFASGTHPVTKQYGENKAHVFHSGSGSSGIGSWSVPSLMNDWRWYASVATLRSGKGLVVSGNQHPRHRVLFGDRNGSPPASPVADSLQRFEPIPDGEWDTPVLPTAGPDGRPAPRSGHTATEMTGILGFNGLTVFGGTTATGPANDLWRLMQDRNQLGAGQTYNWVKIQPGGGVQPRRTDHSAIAVKDSNLTLVVFGGLDEGGNLLSHARRIAFSPTFLTYTWNAIGATGGPAARYGHTAIYDETMVSDTLRKRMIVFGGATSHNGTPTDQNVYELRFNPSDPANPTWHTMVREELGDGQPAARLWHTLSADNKPRNFDASHSNAHAALLYGGKLGDLSYSDELWALWLFGDGRYGWKLLSGGGTSPGARARHSAVLDRNQGGSRLYVYGGERASGGSVVPADSKSYIVDPWASDNSWKQWSDLGFSLRGHTASLDPFAEIARSPEVYDPATNQWTLHSNARMFQGSYPPLFVVPGADSGGSRVININTDDMRAYWSDFPATGQAAQWDTLHDNRLLFRPKTGVQYLPGKIMLAGGSDAGNAITGRTITFNTASFDSAWVASEDMAPRSHHNLVLLPNGKVLAVGGNNVFDNVSAGPVKRPQIWTPGTSGGGTWTSMTGSDRLAEQGTIRGDHSTAILLPDGRVLSAGGENQGPGDTQADADKRLAQLFCPPYLFDSGGNPITTRPQIQGAPAEITWGTAFTVCVDNTASIQSACLMRPGATTHSMDMNQRFIPLTILAKKSSPARLHLTTPDSPDAAPPGDYLLFVLGTSQSADVPSIARWVRVNSSTTPAPDELDLTADLITCSTIGPLRWAAPGDSGCSGKAQEYEVRWSLAPISASNFAAASLIPGVPDPATGGTSQTAGTLTDLEPGTLVYVAGRTRSTSGHWSPLAYAEFGTLTSCGGSGAGASAERTRGEGDGVPDPSAPARGATALRGLAERHALASAATTSRLVAGHAGEAEPRWQLTIEDFAEDPARLAATERAMVAESFSEAEGWVTDVTTPLLPGRAGVRALPGMGRLVFPAGATLESVVLAPRRYALTGANHSRLGDLSGAADGSAAADFVAGDTLTIGFAPATSPGEGEDCLFVVRVPGAALASGARGPSRGPVSGREPASDVAAAPMEFALHPVRPNPFASSATIGFDLPRASRVRIEIFDVQGRRVAELLDRQLPAGRHSAMWDGRLDAGGRAGAGVYLCRITAGGFVAERRVTRLP